MAESEQTNREQALRRSSPLDDDADDKLFTWEMKEHFFMLAPLSLSLSLVLIRVCSCAVRFGAMRFASHVRHFCEFNKNFFLPLIHRHIEEEEERGSFVGRKFNDLNEKVF
jgi:hypothetical protein